MTGPFWASEPKVVVIGGGTGSFTLLSALKHHTRHLTALVNMADDGGSTGVLRDELGTLPPGDVRQCLVALSETPQLRELFNYRFEEGSFKGHAFGNLFLTALEKMTGNFAEGIEVASRVLNIVGTVEPVTLDNVRLKMEWPEASVILQGERVIDEDYFGYDPRQAILSVVPEAKANPAAIAAIEQAELIVIAPGDLYTSLGPLLITPGIGEALQHAEGACVYVSNLVTKEGQTEGFTVNDHASEIERFAGASFLDYVLYNEQQPTAEVAEKYKAEGAYITQLDTAALKGAGYQAIGGNFLSDLATPHAGDVLPVTRSLIRHNSEAVALSLVQILQRVS